ncbi:MAG TPA: hypothetical protein P5191_05615 [Ruminococcus sp.]|nr:hypothetical protein [Ruminococcus sp.]
MLNPASLLKLKNMFGIFRGDHPKLIQYLKIMSGRLTPGTVVELTVELPDGSKSRANVRLNERDIAFINETRNFLIGDKEN